MAKRNGARMVAEAVAAERERCASYVEDILAHGDLPDWIEIPTALRNGSNPHT